MNSVISAYNYSQNFQEVLMGQTFKRLPTRSTSGRLRWRFEGLFKTVVTIKNGHGI